MRECLLKFAQESNRIEGIEDEHLGAYMAGRLDAIIELPVLQRHDLDAFADACGGRLRVDPGMDVRVGRHTPPKGGLEVIGELERLLVRVNDGADPYLVHCDFETLHPYTDGNGRTGRMIWAWMMYDQKNYDFSLLFLHKFYYQTLDHYRE